jgi:hypothetical protein
MQRNSNPLIKTIEAASKSSSDEANYLLSVAKDFLNKSIDHSVTIQGHEYEVNDRNLFASGIHCLHKASAAEPQNKEIQKALKLSLRIAGNQREILDLVKLLHTDYQIEIFKACQTQNTCLGEHMSQPEKLNLSFWSKDIKTEISERLDELKNKKKTSSSLNIHTDDGEKNYSEKTSLLSPRRQTPSKK